MIGVDRQFDVSVIEWRDRIRSALDAVQSQATALERARSSIEELNLKRADLDRRQAEWSQGWADLIVALGLSRTASANEAEAALDEWSRIETILPDLRQTRRRRDGLQVKINAYLNQIDNLTNTLDAGAAGVLPNNGPDFIIRALKEELDLARTQQQSIDECERRLNHAAEVLTAARKAANEEVLTRKRLLDEYELCEADQPLVHADRSENRRLKRERLEYRELELEVW